MSNQYDQIDDKEDLLLSVNAEQDEELQKYRESINKENYMVISKLTRVTLFSFTFMIIELIGGYFSGSLAILTDAAHLLSDLSGFAISILGLWIATKPANKTHSYGFHRAELLGAMTSILIIWALTIWLVFEAVQRFYNPSPIQGGIMLSISCCGLLFNLIMAYILSNDELPNAIEDLEGSEEESGEEEKEENPVLKAAIIHILGDILQSAGVVLASALIYFLADVYPNIIYVDPLCTIIFAVIVLLTTVGVMKQIIRVFMEATPTNVDIDKLSNDLSKVEGVIDIHDIHVWAISIGKSAISLHILSSNPQKTLEQATVICKKHKILHTTIQVEDDTQKDRESFIPCNHALENRIH